MLNFFKTLSDDLNLRWDLRPGDMGEVVRLHGVLYNRECGYDYTFEAYVAAGLAEFALSFRPEKSRLWILEQKEVTAGSIAIVGRSPQEGQLRWFLIHPDYRGRGMGRILLREALQFGRDRGYEKMYLWTLKHLLSATHLYTSAGFHKSEEKTHPLWGKLITEERYDLKL
jgi:GNAT superfamily N-acetyltransferase